MKAHMVEWLVFLAQIINFSYGKQELFNLQDSELSATEGSCIEIKCRATSSVNDAGAYWFWMKNGYWNVDRFTGTIIYSTNNVSHPVNADYASRVKYIGSPSSSWRYGYVATAKPQCNILICNLNKNDSGNYAFRFVGQPEINKWATQNVNLTVKENPCRITFEKPPVVNESDTITLTCSTSISCPSNPQIRSSTQLNEHRRTDKQHKDTTVSFTANWKDDGKEFSCQTQDNKDRHLIHNISVTVEYAPKEVLAKISHESIKEGDSVTLNCTANGRPAPNFTWLYNGQTQTHTSPEWKIMSIKVSHNGRYRCEAHNKYGINTSNEVNIDVTYAPEVEVKMTSPASEVKQRDKITLTCNVKRSNPQPHSYVWFLNGREIDWRQTHVIERIEPEDRGSYTCRATNTVGGTTSDPRQIDVKYGPRKPTISIGGSDKKVKAGNSLTFNCETDANPAPFRYNWHRQPNNKQTDSSQWTSKTMEQQSSLHLQSVQRADDACYECNAANHISTGSNSERLCIDVLYCPTNLNLSLSVGGEVREGALVTIRCTVESFPHSTLTLRLNSSVLNFPQTGFQNPNTLQHTFNATPTDTGLYSCEAENSEGSAKNINRMLVVKYRPKSVTVNARPDFVVKEDTQLTLSCTAQSYPKITSVKWIKMINGKKVIIPTSDVTGKSVSPSDSGLYSCEATNEIGTGKSEDAEVKVMYGPKHTNITRGEEGQNSDGKSFVTLSCISHSYPKISQYSWHMKSKVEGRDEDVEVLSSGQNYTVYSDKPGEYYCIAKNEINHRGSEPVRLFVDGGLEKAVISFFLLLIILLIILLVLFVYRRKRNGSIQRRTTDALPCFRFLPIQGWWNGARRRRMVNEPIMAEPFRSRDDLLSDQPGHPMAQQHQSRPDSMPASNINSVYCTVNLPAGKKGPSAQVPSRQQGGHTQADSLNTASLHFANKNKNKQAKAEEDAVYAMVLKKEPPKKNEQERQEVYENISIIPAARSPDPLNYDSDTSEDEADLNYTQVNFTAKPGHERASGDSSSSEDYETQYSEVKI